MSAYSDIIKLMAEKGVDFASGMSDSEFAAAEEATGIKFPPEVKSFFRVAMPIERGFYNWRDLSQANLKIIRQALNYPFSSILAEVTEDDFWCDDWGPRPREASEAVAKFEKIYNEAPALVPFRSNKYAVQDQNGKTGMLSVVGSDVICYDSVKDFLEVEFAGKKFDPYVGPNGFIFAVLRFWGQLD